jgi:hypothetical protein
MAPTRAETPIVTSRSVAGRLVRIVKLTFVAPAGASALVQYAYSRWLL